jgi:hypothetical protein
MLKHCLCQLSATAFGHRDPFSADLNGPTGGSHLHSISYRQRAHLTWSLRNEIGQKKCSVIICALPLNRSASQAGETAALHISLGWPVAIEWVPWKEHKRFIKANSGCFMQLQFQKFCGSSFWLLWNPVSVQVPSQIWMKKPSTYLIRFMFSKYLEFWQGCVRFCSVITIFLFTGSTSPLVLVPDFSVSWSFYKR